MIFNLFNKDERVPVYFRDHHSILKNVIPNFRSVKPEKAKAFVLWADSFGPAREMAEYGKKLGKPVIIVQHGRNSVREYLPPLNYSPIADKLCVWGTRDYEMLINAGISKERVALTGAPIFDGLSRERNKHDGINILFAPMHWDKEMEENISLHNTLINIINDIKGVRLTTKLLKKYHDISKYKGNVIATDLKDKNLLDDIFALMRKTDILITNDTGTFELIAMYFNIPIIYHDNIKPREFMDTDQKTMEEFYEKCRSPKAVDIAKNINNIASLIKANISYPDRLKADREKELLECAAVGLLKNPAKNIGNVILGMIDETNKLKID